MLAPPDESELRKFTPAGTPEEVTSRLKEILAPFGDHPDVHLVVRLHYPGMDLDTASRAVELFAAEVIPALKDS